MLPTPLTEGQEFELARRHMTLGKLRHYHGPAINNHTDYEVAKEQGLRAPVAGGILLMGHISAAFCALFGTNWLEGGRMEVKFLDYVCPGDAITYLAKVQSAGDPAILEVTCRSDNDRLIMVGTATIPNR